MVEYTLNLDSVFASLADPTRRDILRRVSHEELSIGEVAQPYKLSFAAISKHLQVLERANLIRKRRRGKEQLVCLAPQVLKGADEYLEFYRQFWEDKLDALDSYLKESKERM